MDRQRGGTQHHGYVKPRRSRQSLWYVLGAVVILLAAGIASVALGARDRAAQGTARVTHMLAMADGIPTGPGWEVTESQDPQDDAGCIPLETSCHTLQRTWQTPGPVELAELLQSTGYPLNTFTNGNCASGTVDQNYHVELCVHPGDVVLRMYDK